MRMVHVQVVAVCPVIEAQSNPVAFSEERRALVRSEPRYLCQWRNPESESFDQSQVFLQGNMIIIRIFGSRSIQAVIAQYRNKSPSSAGYQKGEIELHDKLALMVHPHVAQRSAKLSS